MTREEAIQVFRDWDGYFIGHNSDDVNEALNMAIEALEQYTVPFDFDLYQAGLMDMPEGVIEMLDKIRAKIELEKLGYSPSAGYYRAIVKVLQIIDKYKAGGSEE